MSTPLFEALGRQLEKNFARLHMPGHKGVLPAPLDACAPFDMTELPSTGCLFDGQGPILQTERAFADACGGGAALLSAGGSTLCVQAMLRLFCPAGSTVLMARNCHVSAVNAAVLLDLNAVWLIPDEPSGVGTPGRISAGAVSRALDAHPDASAVFLTSPDYFGALCDVAAVAVLCRARGVSLLVDNAHGAHLCLFSGLHPMAQGADACCDSLHKTLPALTGAALLHLRDKNLASDARRAMALFGSTSPSYLVMLSADLLAGRLGALRDGFAALARRVSALRERALQKGVWAAAGPCDPVRIALLFPEEGREQALALLESCRFEPEYVSDRHIVLLPAPGMDLSRVEALIDALPRCGQPPALPPFAPPESAMRLREAALAPAESVALSRALGRIAAAPVCRCPPGMALLMPGERIGGAVWDIIKKTGAPMCSVVK